jgi:hypothetical protein
MNANDLGRLIIENARKALLDTGDAELKYTADMIALNPSLAAADAAVRLGRLIQATCKDARTSEGEVARDRRVFYFAALRAVAVLG